MPKAKVYKVHKVSKILIGLERKDLFYNVNYSAGASSMQKQKEDKSYVEGAGKTKMLKTNIANTAGVKKWVDKAKEELKTEKHWYSDISEWYKGDKEYSGSGWGHGARQSFAEAIGLTDGKVDNLFEAGLYSMLQRGEVDISQSKRLLKLINEDAVFLDYEKEIASKIIINSKYGKEKFNLTDRKGIQLGAERSQGSMWEQFKTPFSSKYKDTWKVAANELTWLLRSIGVTSNITVNQNGSAVITHNFEDQFDLRPSSNGERSIEYDVASVILGFLYHDIAGANDLMKIKGKWNNSYSKEQIDWKANGTKKIEEAMKKVGENMQQERLKWIRETR